MSFNDFSDFMPTDNTVGILLESGEVLVKDYSLTPLVTHYSGKYYSTYKLEDYTDELAKTHNISKTTEFSTKILNDLYNKIVKN